MSLQVLASHMASRGRGGDSMLVHMNPNEVRSLQALAKAHGGELTQNPDTGLPEAGFLSSILPAVAGFALGPGGFGLMSGLGAAATVGGLSALSSGSLQKGLMAGLGAYGGAEMGGALSSLGTDALASQAANGDIGQFLDARQAASVDKMGAFKAGVQAAFDSPGKFVDTLGGGSKMAAYGKMAAAASPFLLASQSTSVKAPEQTPAYVRPYKFDPRTQRYDAQEPIRADQYGTRMMAAGGSTDSEQAYAYLQGQGPYPRRDYTSNFTAVAPVQTTSTGAGKYVYNQQTKTYDWVPDAGNTNKSTSSLGGTENYGGAGSGGGIGGIAGVDAGLGVAAPGGIGNAIGNSPIGIGLGMLGNAVMGQQAPAPVSDAVATPVSSVGIGSAGVGDAAGATGTGAGPGESASDSGGVGGPGGYAAGGIADAYNLGSYSDGGRLLRGPGDGVSDSIPATIGANNQPARLAEGEFVVPARIVSELGNGSTEAGAKQLYAMMDRIQRARAGTVGKKRVAVDSKAAQHLPA